MVVFLINVIGVIQRGWLNMSWAQLMQGCLGAFLIVAACKGYIFQLVLSLDARVSGRLWIFLFPLVVWPFFLVYRIQLTGDNYKSYLRRVAEGSLVEWLGFLLFLVSAFLLLKTATRVKGIPLTFLTRLGGVGLFVLAMEEMSWGQMIFNWNAPSLMDQHNIQSETNLHNLSFLHFHTWTIAACVFSILLIASLCGFYARQKQWLKLGSIADILLPIGCTASYFGIAAVMYWGVVLEKQGVDLLYLHTREQEIAEFLFAVGVFVHSVYLYIDLPFTSISKQGSAALHDLRPS